MKHAKDDFLSGVFSAMQYLVLFRDEPSLAAEVAREHGIKVDWAIKESKRTGFRVRDMNKFIREKIAA